MANYFPLIANPVGNAIAELPAGDFLDLSQSGIANSGNITTAGQFIGSGAGLTSIPGGNVTGTVALATSATTAGTVTTAAQPNITSVGTLTSVSVTGTITGGNLATAGTVSATGNITGGNILGGANVNATTHTGTTVSVTGDVTGGNLITAGNVTGGGITLGGNTISSTGSTLTIDPAAAGVTGTVVIAGNLTVQGTTTTYDSTTVTINDLIFTVANNAATAAAANGGGIEVGPAGSAYAQWTYDQPNSRWSTALGIAATGTITGGNLATGGTASATGNITGGNILTGGLISATGNITGGNILGGANVNATTHTGTTVSVTGNVTGGNLIGTLFTNSIVNSGANLTGNIGSSTLYFNTAFVKATSAQYADLAENYLADANYEPGTVLSFGGNNEVTVSSIADDRRVVGVVTTNPSYTMNAGLGGDHVVAIALIGRVPTKVVGSVRKGDLMVSAGNGHARACAEPRLGTVLGKSIEDFNGESGVIEIFVNTQ